MVFPGGLPVQHPRGRTATFERGLDWAVSIRDILKNMFRHWGVNMALGKTGCMPKKAAETDLTGVDGTTSKKDRWPLVPANQTYSPGTWNLKTTGFLVESSSPLVAKPGSMCHLGSRHACHTAQRRRGRQLPLPFGSRMPKGKNNNNHQTKQEEENINQAITKVNFKRNKFRMSKDRKPPKKSGQHSAPSALPPLLSASQA